MDEDLKDALLYGGGTIFGFATYLAFITLFTRSPKDMLYSTLFLISFIWLLFLTLKIMKIKRGEKNQNEER
ncbi:MAG TPA: hypothetical protein VJH95_04025 [Candidatus Nanoarchaeia archaeon]|nr:hypothetical protein [Candidatus Nanoarchaeia archaeon]